MFGMSIWHMVVIGVPAVVLGLIAWVVIRREKGDGRN